jgi:hypothetical protein
MYNKWAVFNLYGRDEKRKGNERGHRNGEKAQLYIPHTTYGEMSQVQSFLYFALLTTFIYFQIL